jgi:hypothetical protein
MEFVTEKWPTEVWAVEYTSVDGKRIVSVEESEDTARVFVESCGWNGLANPVLLRSDARFTRIRPR